MTTRFAIFSDVHANLAAMEAVAAHIAAGGYDGVYCLGDLGGYASQPNEVQEIIKAMGCPVVLGNYDEGVGFEREDCGCHYIKPFEIALSQISFGWTRAHTSEANKEWLRALPREVRFEAGGQRILLCHGSPRSTTEYLFETRSEGFLKQFTPGGRDDAHADVIVFGHTHVPYHRTVDGVHFINTGSVGRPKDGNRQAGYCALTIEDAQATAEQIRLPYDVEATCEQIARAGLPAYFADYLRGGGVAPHENYDLTGNRLSGEPSQ